MDFPQQIVGVHQPASGDVSLGRIEGAMQGFAVVVIEPITRVEWQQIHLSPLGQVGRLIKNQTTL